MTTSLTYFDFDGSRGLECRLALTLAGVDFEDVRIKRGQWMDLKPQQPYGALPVLAVDGKRLAHSAAILGFIGRAHGLHPSDPWDAARHDAVMVSVEDLRHKVSGRRGMSDEDKKTEREAFAAGWLRQWASTVSDELKGPFLEGDTLSVADLKIFVILRAFLGGTYDHIPASTFDAWPKLAAHQAAVSEYPAVAAYFAGR
jgi:prostaglandin-H2 D-isomerase / glutathione transferase